MLIFGLVAATPVVYLLLFAWIEDHWLPRDELALLVTNLVVGGLLVIGWLLVWRDVVPWTRARRFWTGASVIGTVALAFPVGYAIDAVVGDEELAVVLAGLSWFVIWVVTVSLVWAETPVERARRLVRTRPHAIRCLKCRYNLTGLREARCPECGSAFTLDEIVATARPVEDEWG